MADKALEVASQISNKQITGIISYWYNGQWINIADTNQRNNMQKSIDNLSGLDKTIAALPHSYYSSDQPTGTGYNDTDRWYKTSTDSDGTIKYTPYKWDSTTSSWQPMLDKSAIHTFIGSAPASPIEGDFWTDDTTLKQYQDGSWVTIPTEGPQGVAGTSTYIHVAYAISSDGKTGFSTTSFDGAVYIGILTDSNKNDSTTYTDYTWSRMKGLDGTNGTDGIQGPAGTDGKTTYVHFAYANSSDGKTNFNVVYFQNAEYIGTYTDFTESDSTTYTDYTWSRLKGDTGAQGLQGLQGPQGDQGIQGPTGNDGKSSYTHIAYANSADGKTDFTVSDSNRTYIGIYVDQTSTDSTDPTKYAWTLIKGADGADGKDGVPGKAGADGKTPYFHIAYADSSDGKTNFSLDTPGSHKYIGSYTDFAQADSTNPAVYSWQLVQGPQGDTGATGAQGATTYTWIKYATDSSGSNMSDSPTGMTYLGIAYNKTTSTESSTATDYTWSLIKGEDGKPGTNGTNGADGKTYYFHIAYAQSADGKTGFTIAPDTKISYNYMGTYTDTTKAGSTDTTKYTWVAMFDSTKKRNFTTQPTTPYAVGDTWTQSGATYFCTTARNSGAFTASDWTMQQLTIQSMDSSVTNNLYNDNLLTGTSDNPSISTGDRWNVRIIGVYKTPKVGQEYTISVEVPEADHNVNLEVYRSNNAGGRVSLISSMPIKPGGKDHTTFTWPDPGNSGATQIAVNLAWTNGTDTGTYSYCKAKLEPGTTPTPWCLSQSEITTTTGTYKGVTLNDAGLTATAGSTTVAMNSTDGFLINNTSGQVFHVDTAGNLTMQGDITAGNISGVNFAGNSLTLAGILAVTGAISSQFSYTDDDSIKHDGETVISDGGIKTIDTQTMPTTQTNKPVTTYSFDSNGYRVITYKDDDAYKAGTEISKTSFDNNGIILTMADIRSAYRLGGFSGTDATDSNSTLATIQFGDMLQYASSEVQHSGTPDFKDWFDIIAGIQSHPNLLHNSSLISGTNSWGGLTNGIVYPTNVTHDGNFAICIKSAGGSNFFYQDLQHIPNPGNPICVSFWANIVKNDGGVNGGAFIKFTGANQNYTATLTNTRTGWQYYEFNPITVPSGATGIQFNFYNNEHTGNQVYFAQPMINIGTHTWPYMPTY